MRRLCGGARRGAGRGAGKVGDMAGRNPKDDDAHRAARARQSRPTGAGRPSARARRGAVSGRGRQGRPSADGGASAPHGGATHQSRPRQDVRPPHRDGSGRPAGQRGAPTTARGTGPRGGASRSGAPRDAGSRSGSRGGSARSSTSPRGFAAPGRGSTPRGSTHRGGSAKGAGSRGNAPRTGSASRTGVFTSGSALKAAAWPDDSRGSSSRGARSRDRSQDRGRSRGRPPRPAPKPRYWLRRPSVLLILIGLLAAVGYGILTAAAWTRATIRQQDEQAAADSVVTVYPDPVACPRSSLDVAINVPAETTVGAGLTIGATVTNTGSEACLLDVGGANLGAVIASGTDTVWTSTTCPAEPTSRMLLIDAGDSAAVTLTWDGRRTSPDCAPAPTPTPTTSASPTPSPSPSAAADPSAQATPSPAPSPVDARVAGAGTYRLRLQLAGEDLTGEQVFVIG